jgi:collagenase-like PrtC family protease
MALSIPINFEDAFFSEVDLSAVDEVYGKFSSDCVGGGRPSIAFTGPSKKDFIKYVAEVHKRGIHFNYLLNSTCIDNIEFTKKGHWAIRKLLDFICEQEIRSVTIVLPTLAAIIRKYYPQLRINVSTNALVDRLEKVHFWEDAFGVEQITLCHTAINRDFPELKRIIKYKHSCDLQLICNLFCKRNCGIQGLHANFQSHASQVHHKHDLIQADYFCLNCTATVFLDPEEVIKAGWIRPEDLCVYEQIGIKKFKLAERGLTTKALANIVSAYTNRKYDGNFADLIPSDAKYKFIVEKNFWHFFKHYFKPGTVNIRSMNKALRSLMELQKNTEYTQHLGIDMHNPSLDSFVNFFIHNDCRSLECKSCGYCSSWASKTIKKIPPANDQSAPEMIFAKVVDTMISDDLY